MGECALSCDDLIAELQRGWRGSSYQVLGRNYCDFATVFCQHLSCLPGVPICQAQEDSGQYSKTCDAAGAVPVDANVGWRRVAFSQNQSCFPRTRRSSTLCLDGTGGYNLVSAQKG